MQRLRNASSIRRPARYLTRAAALFGLAEQELADHLLQHDGRLRDLQLARFFQVGIGPARAEADVLAAQQSGREDAGIGIIGNLVEPRVNAHAHHGIEPFIVNDDAFDTPDIDAGHRHG